LVLAACIVHLEMLSYENDRRGNGRSQDMKRIFDLIMPAGYKGQARLFILLWAYTASMHQLHEYAISTSQIHAPMIYLLLYKNHARRHIKTCM
jgi:hypothetical protein